MIRSLQYSVHEIADYISWSYFFHAWGLPAKFASVTRVHGCSSCRNEWINAWTDAADVLRAREAVRLYDDALQLLREADGQFGFQCRFGLFPANSDGDDVLVSAEGGATVRLPFLRQQYNPSPDGFCRCLADYIRPASQGVPDVLGVFVASNDARMERQYPDDGYLRMLCQTLSDRLVEAGTERAHMEIRRGFWGYAPDESLTIDDMLAARYRGIRPAVGYPSIPDQSIAFLLRDLVDFGAVGVELTESGAMTPHASVCGLMFAHPEARYFSVGKIGDDQLADYDSRRGLPEERMRAFLGSNLQP